MENLINAVRQEMKLRDDGKRGILGHISDMELVALAYRLKIIR